MSLPPSPGLILKYLTDVKLGAWFCVTCPAPKAVLIHCDDHWLVRVRLQRLFANAVVWLCCRLLVRPHGAFRSMPLFLDLMMHNISLILCTYLSGSSQFRVPFSSG